MKTIIRPIEPPPVLADAKPPGRWIWGPKVPITDMCRGGNSACSWWADHSETDIIPEKYCPILRPKNAKVECVFDGERWVRAVRVPEPRVRRKRKA